MSPGRETMTLVRSGDGEVLSVPSMRVRLRRPGVADVERALSLAPVVIGSGADCDLVLDDPYVSRRHCRLALDARGVVVRDLGSRNGTYIRGVRIAEAVLPVSEELALGQARVAVISDGQTVELPLSATPRFGEAVGRSPAMRALFARLGAVAAADDPVLLLGESGTGKESLARAIHDASPRRAAPFVVFDCGAVAPSLVESELFGHEKGAFTGAVGARLGILESTQGGTVLLDEVGELPVELQPRLLRALESREVRPVGGNRPRAIDVRIVAATHRDLRARVAAGAFREDLYFRLAVVEVRIPPLRERVEDIPLLVEHLLARRTPPCALDDLAPGTLDMLRAHAWPGNVRELRNTLARLVLFRGLGDPAAAIGSAPPVVAAAAESSPHFHDARAAVIADFEHRFVMKQLRANEVNVSAAARAMGISRQHLHKLIAHYGLRADLADADA